jgi:hypothetical protein
MSARHLVYRSPHLTSGLAGKDGLLSPQESARCKIAPVFMLRNEIGKIASWKLERTMSAAELSMMDDQSHT